MDINLLREIRHKQDKTPTEELLLKYHYVIANINEILVSESKWHIKPDKAIKEIRQIMRDKL